MPTISIFYGMVVQMYWNDHAPPHFHVRYAEWKATIEIDGLQILTGSLPRRAERLVLEWAAEHKGELLENWIRCEQREYPTAIEPLS